MDEGQEGEEEQIQDKEEKITDNRDAAEENNSDSEKELKDIYRHIANQIIILSQTNKRNSDDQNIDIEDSNETLKRKPK